MLMKRLAHFFAVLALVLLSAGCLEKDDALRVEARIDGVLYSCPSFSYDTYFPFYLAESDTAFKFSFSRYVTSDSGRKAYLVVRINEDEPFELNKRYYLEGSSLEGGNYALLDWTYESVEGYVVFVSHADAEGMSYMTGRFEFIAADDETGETVSVTDGLFENLHVAEMRNPYRD